MKSILVLVLSLVSFPVFAGVTAYSGDAGEKMFLEAAPALGKDAYLIKFEGVDSPWNDKVILVKRKIDSRQDERFSFDYDLELSSGIQKKNYEILTQAGFELIEGSRVKKVELHYQGTKARVASVKLNQDRKLTDASQKVDLVAAHKKAPFKPDVD